MVWLVKPQDDGLDPVILEYLVPAGAVLLKVEMAHAWDLEQVVPWKGPVEAMRWVEERCEDHRLKLQRWAVDRLIATGADEDEVEVWVMGNGEELYQRVCDVLIAMVGERFSVGTEGG
jgi:hypothetical protein